MEEMIPLNRESSQMLSLDGKSSEKNLTICYSEEDFTRALQLKNTESLLIPPSPPLAPSIIPDDSNKKQKNKKKNNNNISINNNNNKNGNKTNTSLNAITTQNQQKNAKTNRKFWQKKEKTKQAFREQPNSACAHLIQGSKELKKFLASSGLQLVTCPNSACGCIFEKMSAGHDIDPNMIGMNGKPISPEATQHYLEYRFRCRECNTEFCSSCLASPYHIGYNCSQYVRSLLAKCRFCGSEVAYGTPHNVRTPFCSHCYKKKGWFTKRKMYRCARCFNFYHTTPCATICSKGVTLNNSSTSPLKMYSDDSDRWTCHRCQGMEVCASFECQSKATRACPRRNICGHYCIGVKDEFECPPCHHPDCERSKSGKQTSEDFCNICWVEPLGSAPCLSLPCGHTFHYSCVLERTQKKWNGPSINFNYLNCPLCNTLMSHPLLFLSEDMALYNDVKRKAMEMLIAEKMQDDEAIISKNGRFFADSMGYALHIFTFYRCYYCGAAYCGGKRSCEEGAGEDEQNGSFDAKNYICSTCTTRVCPIHGDQGLMFKCRFCCHVATWFCFGNTHYCDKCHETPYVYCDGKGRLYPAADNIPVCAGPDVCPLGVKHPVHGTEHALRCVLCEENAAKGVVELPKIRVEVSPGAFSAEKKNEEHKLGDLIQGELDLLEMKPYCDIVAAPAESDEAMRFDDFPSERLVFIQSKDHPLPAVVQDSSSHVANKWKEKEIDEEDKDDEELLPGEKICVKYQQSVSADKSCVNAKCTSSSSFSSSSKDDSLRNIGFKKADDESEEDDSYDESCDSDSDYD